MDINSTQISPNNLTQGLKAPSLANTGPSPKMPQVRLLNLNPLEIHSLRHLGLTNSKPTIPQTGLFNIGFSNFTESLHPLIQSLLDIASIPKGIIRNFVTGNLSPSNQGVQFSESGILLTSINVSPDSINSLLHSAFSSNSNLKLNLDSHLPINWGISEIINRVASGIDASSNLSISESTSKSNSHVLLPGKSNIELREDKKAHIQKDSYNPKRVTPEFEARTKQKSKQHSPPLAVLTRFLRGLARAIGL